MTWRREGIGLAIAAPLLAIAVPVGGAAVALAPTCHGRPATIIGTSGDDSLIGTPGPDVIVGLAGMDHIEGRGGDDILCGGPGYNDEVFGGRGDDWVTDRHGRWSMVGGGPGDDVLVVGGIQTLLSYRGSPRSVVINLRTGHARGFGRDRIVSGSDRASVYGSRFDDVILGPARGGHFFTLGGSDRVVVTDGSSDSYPRSIVESGGGADVLIGGPGIDALSGGYGPDRISGRAGRDYLDGGGGSDVIHGGAGDDEIDGGEISGSGTWGPDLLFGGAGDDSLNDMFVDHGDQAIDGGPGHDSLYFASDWDVNTDMTAGTLHIPSQRVTIPVRSILDLETEYGDITWTAYGTDRAEHYGAYDTQVIAYMLGGDDVVISRGDTDDYVDGGDGTDEARLEDGTDTCINVEVPDDCEVIK